MVELDVILVVVLLVLVGAFLVVRHLVRFSKGQLANVAGRTADVRAKLQPPGPGRDAALLRMRLEAEVRATREMLANAPQGVVFRADARALLAEVETAALSLSSELDRDRAVPRHRPAARRARRHRQPGRGTHRDHLPRPPDRAADVRRGPRRRAAPAARQRRRAGRRAGPLPAGSTSSTCRTAQAGRS